MGSMESEITPINPGTDADVPADVEQTEQRKADHIRINVEEDVAFKSLGSGLDSYFFMHRRPPFLVRQQPQ